MTTPTVIFKHCVEAIRDNKLIHRKHQKDKEFHFQNWFEKRLKEIKVKFYPPKRHDYPDFQLVHPSDGYELKGLAYPGRETNYDCNSQAPRGEHNEREVYYVFGRYPKKPDGKSYPIIDFVICHGSFLNADTTYVHENKNFKGFGSYGDILVRDRKMYVAPTPFALAEGVAHTRTLILPAGAQVGEGFTKVGDLVRYETSDFVAGYRFDLTSNELTPENRPNPSAGRVHAFAAYRLADDPTTPVTLRDQREVLKKLEAETEED